MPQFAPLFWCAVLFIVWAMVSVVCVLLWWLPSKEYSFKYRS